MLGAHKTRMKLFTSFLALAVIAHGSFADAYTYNGYVNRRLEKGHTNLFGKHRLDKYQEKDAAQDSGNLRRRRTEGEVPTPPPETTDEGEVTTAPTMTDDEFVEGREQQSHYQAETLDYFKKGIDPELFEWVNPDEIAPGAITCGFLKPNLGSLEDVIYPTIEVYVCMRFANTQPASKGNLFLHCGGPGSLSDCIYYFDEDLGEQNLNDFNLLSIDQRGMGRSWPSFVHEECSGYVLERADNGTIVNYTLPPELVDDTSDNLTFSVLDTEYIKTFLREQKYRVETCWTCTTCDFQLEAEQPDGNVTSFHFLEYSGTRQLAEDIARVTDILNAPVMHVYGVSYGTGVFSAFATVAPSYVGLFILDSCISPNPDHYHNARTAAIGMNERIDYIIYSCSALGGSCPVADMRKCVGDISSAFDTAGIGQGTIQTYYLQQIILVLFRHSNRAEDICDAAAKDPDLLEEIILELEPELFGGGEVAMEARKKQAGSDPRSAPTFAYNVYDNPDYAVIESFSQSALISVRAQDRSGPIYDVQRFAKEVLEIAERYTGAGTGGPGMNFMNEYSIGYYWPKAVPLPPAGNPYLTGVIIGILYDSNTPYAWTQEMRRGFPYTSLITNQGIFHGIGSNDPGCQRHVRNYLEDGYISFVDGEICGAGFATVSDFGAIFGGASFEGSRGRGRRRSLSYS